MIIKKGRLKTLKSGFQTTSFIQSTQAWDNSSSVGFAHEINKNTAILRMNIQQVSWAKPTLLVVQQRQLVPSPVRRGKARMGVASRLDGFATLGKIKFVQPIEPPSPQPSPAGRERGQVARLDIDFCPATVIPA